MLKKNFFTHKKLAALTVSQFFALTSTASNLPEERADIMFHSYDGGGIEITGPSVLVRKNIKDTVSVYGNYYVDQVSSASIDVITSGASAYKEERTEYSFGAEYLYNKSSFSLSATQSTENDYDASTLSFDVSQEFFGDMTTFSLGYSHGDDTVKKKNDDSFEEAALRKKFRVGITQVLSPKWLLGLSAEKTNDQGFLNNPYRSIRYLNKDVVATQAERYPHTRNSDTLAARTIYYLPYRASVRAEYRSFNDNWGIKATNAELRYLHPYNQWTFQASIRNYSQTQASFYADLFPYADSQRDFLARDKEMSEYASSSFGIGIFYDIDKHWVPFFDKATLNFQLDHMEFDYTNFRDARLSMGENAQYQAGSEPLYSLKANVIRLFISVFY